MSHHDPLDIHGQEAAQAQAEERIRLAVQSEIEDLKWLMSNRRGRRHVLRQLTKAGIWRSSFNTNALSMAFAEGRRFDGLSLLEQINRHCPARYDEMLKESNE